MKPSTKIKRSKLEIVPISFAEAAAFVGKHHRHHKPARGHKFSIAVADESGTIRGVAMIGRPVARLLDNGWTLEVNRVATDGCANACSALYGAAWRAAKALGYRRLVTYILETEGGASLRGAGWKLIGKTTTAGRGWDCKSRPRIDLHPLQQKLRFERNVE